MLGEAVRIIRIANDMLIKNIADGVGCTANHISEIENGNKRPSLTYLRRFSIAYNIPVSIILRLQECMERDNLSFQVALIGVLRYYINGELDFSIEKEEQRTR